MVPLPSVTTKRCSKMNLFDYKFLKESDSCYLSTIYINNLPVRFLQLVVQSLTSEIKKIPVRIIRVGGTTRTFVGSFNLPKANRGAKNICKVRPP